MLHITDLYDLEDRLLEAKTSEELLSMAINAAQIYGTTFLLKKVYENDVKAMPEYSSLIKDEERNLAQLEKILDKAIILREEKFIKVKK